MIVNGCLHGRESVTDPHVRKSGVNHGALPLPSLAIRHKNTVADEVLEGVHHQIAFREHAFGISHDLAHSVRVIEEDRGAPGVAEVADVEMISRSGQQLEQITIALPQHAGQRDNRPKRQGLGRDVRDRRSHFGLPDECPQYGGVV